jgi:hypothetical protein
MKIESEIVSGGKPGCPDCERPMWLVSDFEKTGTVFGGAGGAAIGFLGRTGGASAGALVGSIVPGIGTAIGAGVGGLAGATAGFLLGSSVGKQVGKAIDQQINEYYCPLCKKRISQ